MRRNAQRGFGVIAAIVILVIMAALGTFIVTLTSTQQAGSALDVNGSRAYAAALSGTEWGIFQALNGSCLGTTTLAQTINSMTVTVSCTLLIPNNNTVEAGMTFPIYRITANACNQAAACPSGAPGAPNYVERQVVAHIE